MIKVLHFYKTYYPNSFGGIEQVIYQLSEAGNKHNITSYVLSLNELGEVQNKQLNQHKSYYSKKIFEYASTPFSMSVFKTFQQLAQQVDIIHYHFPWPFMDLVHFACQIKKPTVVTYHSDIIKQKFLFKLYLPLMKQFFASVDCIVASSPNYLESSPILKKYRNKVKVIPYGLDVNSYPIISPEKKKYWRDQFGERFFLFIGTFRYYKGLHILIEAAKGSSYPIVIVGAGSIEQELKQQAKTLGVNNIHFLGALSDEDKTTLLTLCSAVVFPSFLRSEAFGITLLEGAMFGKPMISCEIGTGTTYINIANETGLVIPPADAPALRLAMDKLWQDPSYAEKLGCNAAKRFKKLFTAEKMAKNYIALYQSLIEKKL